MNPERWQKVNELFHAAIERGAAERNSFLKKACAGDQQLFAQVERLVSAHEQADDFIQNPVVSNAVEILSEERETSPLIGKRFGVYKIVREIGRGGMGAVFLAERTDSEFEKRAAVKIIKRGMDTDAVLRRFRNERQILASLEHPNIARLLDGGTTEDGLPYFVMEYIEGLPITEFAEARGLSVKERLELFRQVCAAVAFAHQRLVVHRDIKPSNILVTEDGTPKLLDFGIAKLINPERTDKETQPTVTGVRLMTPEYASPEQISGGQVLTLSDVYSLGVVLYELLTGRSPYRFEGNSPLEIFRIVSSEQPPKPSDSLREKETQKAGSAAKTSSETIAARAKFSISASQLKGDLDNIVLKAMRKEPEQRYVSVSQFSEDIRRHLVGLPVIARPLNLKYRFAKFARRNKSIVALVSIIFLTLVAGIVATTWQSIRANWQKELAEKRFNEVRKLARTVLFDYHDAIKDLPGSTAVRARLVHDALEYLDSLAAEASDDVSLQRELAAAYERVGDVQGGTLTANLGDTAGAIESYRKALAILETLENVEPPTVETRLAAAICFRKLGSLLWETGDMEAALENNRKALSRLQKLAQENPDDFTTRFELAATYDRTGAILQEQGSAAEAREYFQKHLETLETFSESEQKNEKMRRGFSVAYEHFGIALLDAGDFEKALENINQAVAARESLAKDFPLNADYQRTLAVSYYNRGEILTKMKRYREALESYQKDVAIVEALAAKDPKNEQYRDDIAYGLIRFGDMFVELGEPSKALANYRKSETMRAEDVKADPTNLWKRSSLIEAHAKICKTLAKTGQTEAAKNECEQTLALMEKTEVEPTNAAIRSFFADTFADLAEAYSAPKTPFQTAKCEMYKKSLEIREDMKNRGIMNNADAEKFVAAQREVNLCQNS